MVAFAFRAGPFDAAFLIAVLGHFLPPQRYRVFHYPLARGITELFRHTAGPVIALVAGVVSFAFEAVAHLAGFAGDAHGCGRVIFLLHAPQACGLFRFEPIEVGHDRPEFFIPVTGRDVNAAGAAIQAARRHQTDEYYLHLSNNYLRHDYPDTENA